MSGNIVWEKFKKSLDKYHFVNPGDSVLVACSGGPDSMCMLDLFCRLRKVRGDNIDIFMAYVDHGLRPKEVKREIELLKNTANRLNLLFSVEKIKIDRNKRGSGLEALARRLRYRALVRVARKYRCNKITTGHNLDDQAETVLFNLLRSTGETGLFGMPAVRQIDSRIQLVRPLLGVPRMEIEDYLNEHHIKFCKDSTNLSKLFTRNRIRSELVPILKKFNPGISEHLGNLAYWAETREKYFDGMVKKLEKQCVVKKTKKIVLLDLSKIIKYNKYLQYKFFRYVLLNFVKRKTYSKLIEEIFGLLKTPGISQMPFRVLSIRQNGQIKVKG